jgi:hypothetical protein
VNLAARGGRRILAPHGVDEVVNGDHLVGLKEQRGQHRALARRGEDGLNPTDAYAQRAEYPKTQPNSNPRPI